MLSKYIVCAIFCSLLFSPLWGQKASPVSEEERSREIVIEIREFPSNGGHQGNGADSLSGDHYVVKNGVIYKVFNHFEPFVAHYNGYHSRPKATADRHIVYIKSLDDAGKFDLNFPQSEGWGSYLLKYDRRSGDIDRIE